MIPFTLSFNNVVLSCLGYVNTYHKKKKIVLALLGSILMFPLQKSEILNRNPFGGPLTFIMMTMMMMIMMMMTIVMMMVMMMEMMMTMMMMIMKIMMMTMMTMMIIMMHAIYTRGTRFISTDINLKFEIFYKLMEHIRDVHDFDV